VHPLHTPDQVIGIWKINFSGFLFLFKSMPVHHFWRHRRPAKNFQGRSATRTRRIGILKPKIVDRIPERIKRAVRNFST